MTNDSEKIEYPVIVNKYLALKKISSRKEADRLLRAGKIMVNGRLAEPGQMIIAGDKVEVDLGNKNLVYLAFNKPRGIITHSPQAGERSIADILRFHQQVFPIGRLDKMSSGLIILTNDGRITDKLLNPNFFHEKEYEVDVDRPLTPEFLKKMTQGVELDDGYVTKKCRVKKIRAKTFLIILTEGKKHQIRRMCEALGQKVVDLRRLRIMNIALNGLIAGKYRQIIGPELREFLHNLEMN
ncbi:MAG: pseudouridine synthase [Patescibacteria group bacterium]|nr:pseudouridine synthase [Patescibacteria group bacterium]